MIGPIKILNSRFRKFRFYKEVRILIMSLAGIFIWRGITNLLDKYLFPENFLFSNIFTIVVGFLILYLVHDKNDDWTDI